MRKIRENTEQMIGVMALGLENMDDSAGIESDEMSAKKLSEAIKDSV